MNTRKWIPQGNTAADRAGWTLTGSAALSAAQTSAERRDECFAAIDAMVDQIARLRAEMAARGVAAAENCNAATAMRHERDHYRHALEVIANARADHVASGLIYTARKALDRE